MTDTLAEKPAKAVKKKTGLQRKKTVPAQSNYAAELLAFESEVRSIQDVRELNLHLCNSARRVIPFKQCFYGKVSPSCGFTLKCSSSVSIIDRNAPFSRWIEKLIGRLLKVEKSNQSRFTLPKYCDDTDEEKDLYPFTEFLWTPQVHNGEVVGGMLMARDTQWIDAECAKAMHISHFYLHAQAAINGQKSLAGTRLLKKPLVLGLCALGLLAGFLPVSITALAPVEVVPSEAYVLAAPFDGVVKEITVNQGEALNPGDTVIVFDDVHLLNAKKLADQSAAIADARYQRASQGAIGDHRAKREIEVAKAEYALALAESQYANELLDQSKLTTPVSGIAIYSDKSDWEGKPVAAGEAIVSVADPSQVELDIDLPVKESIVLTEGARIKIFLDSDPLNPLEATLSEANYRAQPDKRDILAYSLTARLKDDSDRELPRIGVQGTAQVFSEKASLAYVVFRRPIAAFRQYTGW